MSVGSGIGSNAITCGHTRSGGAFIKTFDWTSRRVRPVMSGGSSAAKIGSRSIAAFHADNGDEAALRVCDCSFRDDLMVLATAGRPLWDGMAAIDVREALAGEATKWRASRAQAIRLGNIEDDDDAWIAFLVPLNDPGRKRRPV